MSRRLRCRARGGETRFKPLGELGANLILGGEFPRPHFRGDHVDDLDLRRRLHEPRTGTRRVNREPMDATAVLDSWFSVLTELDQLNASWFELGRIEERERNAAPNQLPVTDCERKA